VSLPRNTRVIPVNFESTDPRLAAQIVNRYVEILITGNLQRHFNTSRYSKEFLQDQLHAHEGETGEFGARAAQLRTFRRHRRSERRRR
jgi:uncharacterized protein involved in exopolysaccharide biosynthesis